MNNMNKEQKKWIFFAAYKKVNDIYTSQNS